MRIKKQPITQSVLTIALLAVGISSSMAGSDLDKKIAQARASAPASIGA